jgi:hypothetical protein
VSPAFPLAETKNHQPESIVETNQHGHLVLECMQLLDMEAGDRVSVDDLAEYAFGKGVGLDELENAIIHASSNGWIHTTDDQVYLTAGGYKLLNPANDNSQTIILPN